MIALLDSLLRFVADILPVLTRQIFPMVRMLLNPVLE